MLRNALGCLGIAALVLVAGASLGCSGRSSAPAPQTVANKAWGFSITFPGDWRKWEGGLGSLLEAYPPDQTDPNNRTDIVYVNGEAFSDTVALPLMYTLDEFVTIKAAGVSKLPGYRETEKKTIDLNGTPAAKLVWSDDRGLTSIAYFVISGRRAYTVLLTADSAHFKEREPVYEQIAKSFKVAEPAADKP